MSKPGVRVFGTLRSSRHAGGGWHFSSFRRGGLQRVRSHVHIEPVVGLIEAPARLGTLVGLCMPELSTWASQLMLDP